MPTSTVATLVKTDSSAQNNVAEEGSSKSVWPLSYRISVPVKSTPTASPKQWWSHALYRGPEDHAVEVHYSRTREQSENLAKKFLHEPVVGFDMEWPFDAKKRERLQEKVSLIQVACEDKIGLFHLGLHTGTTTDELIAPSLRKLIQGPAIVKTGVGVHNADMARLKDYFKLRPQGAFELSHLHRLISYGASEPQKVTTSLVALATLVQEHLGLPLWKGSVRCSDWSRPLSGKQRDYAAADAYAGFMLYHCLNAKRLTMTIPPPLPIFAEKYRSLEEARANQGNSDGVKVDEAKMDGAQMVEVKVERSATAPTGDPTKPTKQAPKRKNQTLDPAAQELYTELKSCRDALAARHGVPVYMVAHNATLQAMATFRPTDEAALLKIKRVGKVTVQKYGAEFLAVIQRDSNAAAAAPSDGGPVVVKTTANPKDTRLQKDQAHAQTPIPRRRREPDIVDREMSSSPAFGTPLLRTGLSFRLESSSLDKDALIGADIGDVDEAFENIESPSSRRSSGRKRKRCTTPPVPTPERKLQPLSPRRRIFRNKVEAYSRRIASLVIPRPVDPLVSPLTLDAIVENPPKTIQELNEIPGISRLAAACNMLNKDLLDMIGKFAPARY
ncbi:ribonuclease H-like protein [Sporormia fimetaria CBS 119925]|uniref:Ribonuclease H-like protein n=1 Tax=Sporormia fimetaria CBS 119925 TaxID=1340428 RepID=A0A6A6UXF0_9PLEO|nr:ribonuclease H-like protein [Sporormia fimetaria CBS 119925]